METLYTTKRNQSNIAPPGEAAPVAVIGELNVDLLVTGLAAMPKFGYENLAASFETVLGSAFSGKNLESCPIMGNACGALSALKAGGTAGQPTANELAAFLAQHQTGRSTSECKEDHRER